jgi:hypothetical protein
MGVGGGKKKERKKKKEEGRDCFGPSCALRLSPVALRLLPCAK